MMMLWPTFDVSPLLLCFSAHNLTFYLGERTTRGRTSTESNNPAVKKKAKHDKQVNDTPQGDPELPSSLLPHSPGEL